MTTAHISLTLEGVNIPAVATAPPDFVTVATALPEEDRHPILTKTWAMADGKLCERSHDKGKWHRFEEKPVAGLDDLLAIIEGLDVHSCLVHGRIREGVDRERARRTHVGQPDDPPSL